MKNSPNMLSPFLEKILVGVLIVLLSTMCLGLVGMYTTLSSVEVFAAEGKRYTQEDHQRYKKEIAAHQKETTTELKELRSAVNKTNISVVKMEASFSALTKQLERVHTR